MAKTISDEQMKLSIIINGNSAQKEILDLEKKTINLKNSTSDLMYQRKMVKKQLGEESEEYKKLTRDIKNNNREIEANEEELKTLIGNLKVSERTMEQLGNQTRELSQKLRLLDPNSADWKKYNAELTEVKARIGELKTNAASAKMSLGSLADGFNRYQGLALSFIATLTGVAFSIQKIIDINGKLSDAQADVMKTTGMTKEEVDELTKSFGALQTRTSRIDLLGIAQVGGKLGIAKNEIADFVTVMNKASVALGDSFEGGAEEVADKLGKIKGLYGELRDAGVEASFEAVGSALNDLGAAGVASESNVADFVTRIGSMPEVFKPSIAEALGLGAAFEESGINAEKAGSNYAKVITLAANNVAGFAKQMGKPKKAIEDLINTNPTEFFLQFSQSLKGLSGTQLASVLDSLKLNDNEVKQVLGAASQNVDLFRDKIKLAGLSMADASSLTDEYIIKNNNLAATLDKIKKTVTGWFSSETFIKWLTVAVDWVARFVGATKDADGSVSAWRNTLVFAAKVIAIVTAALITNTAWQQLVVLWTTRNTQATLLYNIAAKARAFADGVAMVASQAYAMTTMLLTRNIKGAIQAFRVMTATMMTTPWGFILGAVAAVTAAYVLFSEEAKEASATQKMLSEVTVEANKSIASEKAELEALVKIAGNEKIAKEDRLKAIKKLNEIIPDYIGQLTLENLKTFEGTKILKQYTAELYANARAKAVQSRFDKLSEEKVAVESKSAGEYRKEQTFGFLASKEFDSFKTQADFEKYVAKKFKHLDQKEQKEIVNKFIQSSGMEDKIRMLNDLDAQMKALEPEILQNKIKDLQGENNNSTSTKNTNDIVSEGTAKNDPNSTQAEINKLKLEAQYKYNEAALRLQRQLEDDRIAAMEDGYAKELALENQRYQREIDDLQRQKVHTEEMAKLDEDIAKAKQDKDITGYNALLQIKKGWKEKNLLLDAQIDSIIEGKAAIHNLKLATIEEKGAKDILDKRKKAHEEAKVQRELAYQQELLALGNNEIAKRKLTQQYQQNELIEEEKFLKELLEKFKDIIDKGGFEGINLDLLSPEQVAQFEAEAAKVGLTLQQLIQKKNELSGNGSEEKSNALGLQAVKADIFGFTPENWLEFFNHFETTKEKIESVIFAIEALTNAYSMYDQFATASENARVQKFEKQANQKKTIFKKQLDAGYINQNQYNKLTEQLDNDLAKKKAEIEHKQAKRQKAIAISQIATNTAKAIIGIWADFPKADFGATAAIMSGVVGALGLAQIAKVAKEPLPSPGFEEGLYDTSLIRRQQDGKVFSSRFGGKTKSGLVKDTSHYMVGENGPEMIIDNKAWTQMNPNLKDALIREIQSIKGFENGYYKEGTLYSENTNTNVEDNSLYPMMLAMLTENVALLQYFKENGLNAYVSNKDMNSMRKLKEGLDKYNAIRNENRK